VACGAFDGIRAQLAEGNRKAAGLGFGSAGAKAARSDIRDALVKYGFMEQIVNRIGAIIVLPDPTPAQIVRITTNPGTGLLARQNSFLQSFGMNLDVTDEAIQYLANWACEIRGYSRAVKTILGTLVEGHLYDEKPGDINVWLADVKRAINETEGAEGLQK
jgi:ATP-dependent protease Clp ATPase subunit